MLTVSELETLSSNVRAKILKMIFKAGSGHPGGSLSSVDILLTLYYKVMKHDPNNPKWEKRDRFILSKGHAAPALYIILAECGYISKDWLDSLRLYGSILQGHPDARMIDGIEVSSGSLGNGLSVAAGLATAGKLDTSDFTVYCLIGDGESDEGLIWEAAMYASHYKLDNLIAILDRNQLQIDGFTEDVMGLEPLMDKWKAFGWNVIEVDGHDYDKLLLAFDEAKKSHDKPSILIANTTKGKGVSFMENSKSFHGKPPNLEQLNQALKELGVDK